MSLWKKGPIDWNSSGPSPLLVDNDLNAIILGSDFLIALRMGSHLCQTICCSLNDGILLVKADSKIKDVLIVAMQYEV